MSHYVNFLKAGTYPDYEQVIFFSAHRQAAKRKTIFHNNDKSSVYRLPNWFFKEYFTYDRSAGIYRTKLLYKEVKQYLTVIDHRIK